MKLAKQAFLATLLMLALLLTASAQTLRSENDTRNLAPTVGTGGPPGGPTGLFTVYDGQTLRKGEFTFSAAYSNYDRDPGDVDIVEVPISFQIGLSDYVELFFNTDAYRGIKVNSPRNLSGFYLPNSRVLVNGVYTSGPAIVLAPRGPGTSQYPGAAVFRPAGTAPFAQFPYAGANAGTFGLQAPFNAGTIFGFPGGFALLGPAGTSSGNAAANFPGIGSVFGGILPGIVLATVPTTNAAGTAVGTAPSVYTLAPSYLPDAPLLNRVYGESAFNTFTIGAKMRFTGPNNPIGIGLIPFYRFYADTADDFAGFNQLQRGASPGGNRGDFGLVGFADARLRKWLNVSANLGYIYNSSIKSNNTTLLDRPDEVLAGIGVDFPVNKFFQPILEFRSTYYVGGRTPNAFENSPIEGLAGARIFPHRWMSLGAWYRYHANAQDSGSFDGSTFGGSVAIVGRTGNPQTFTFNGRPPGFRASTDPHGFGFQMTLGRRNARRGEIINQNANVNAVNLSDNVVRTPCGPGTIPAEGSACADGMSVNVSTSASDPENDVLTYSYTVSGGRVVGTGANVSWDLGGVSPGTYTITAGVDDGCGVCGQTKTETITVEKCDCIDSCDCPKNLTVSGPTGLTAAGETITFTANVTPGSGTTTYQWSVSNGSIVGSATGRSVRVGTTSGMQGQNVVATVNIGSDPDCNCDGTASETAVIRPVDTSDQVDEYGKLADNDVKIRIQNFYEQYLNPNPNSRGYIINYGTAKDIARSERQIQKAITFLKLDRSRVTIVRGFDDGNGQRTTLWFVPPNATPPTP